MEAHHAKTNRTFTHRGIFRTRHGIGRMIDKVLKHVIKETQNIFDELRVILPGQIMFKVQRRQAANSSAIPAQMILAGRQRDFRTQVRRLNTKPGQLVVFRHRTVHSVDEQHIGLAGFNARRQQTYPQ